MEAPYDEWNRNPEAWLQSVGVPQLPVDQWPLVDGLLPDPERIRLIYSLWRYGQRAGDARAEASRWARLPVIAFSGFMLGCVVRFVSTLPHTMSRQELRDLAPVFVVVLTVWLVAVLWMTPSARPRSTETHVLRGLLTLAALLGMVVLAGQGYDLTVLWLGLILGGVTTFFLIVGLGLRGWILQDLPRWLLRTRYPEEHASVLLFGLLVGMTQAPNPRDRREWQPRIIWGIEEIATTIQFSRLSTPPSLDANTFRWRREAAARRAEAVREWKRDVIEPRRGSSTLPTGQIRKALLLVQAGHWGALREASTTRSLLGWRDWVGAAFAAPVGLLGYYGLVDFSEALATFGVDERIVDIFRKMAPLLALYAAWFVVPPEVKRAVREQAAGLKDVRDLGSS